MVAELAVVLITFAPICLLCSEEDAMMFQEYLQNYQESLFPVLVRDRVYSACENQPNAIRALYVEYVI